MFKRGTQVIYVPFHADGPGHPDCEAGFVTSATEDWVFCRFWSKHHEGLRDKSVSKSCRPSRLVVQDTHSQEKVEKALDMIGDAYV